MGRFILKTENLIQSRVRISGKIGVYEMPEDTYSEIDEPSDWVVEAFIKTTEKGE